MLVLYPINDCSYFTEEHAKYSSLSRERRGMFILLRLSRLNLPKFVAGMGWADWDRHHDPSFTALRREEMVRGIVVE